MLLTLTTTHNPATDLGYLLHKNPAKLHSFELSFGKAHIFYPEATTERCTAALLLDVDPVGLVRGKRGQHEGGTLDQYVNDRPYVLSSFLSVAMGRTLGTAMTGLSKGRQEWADEAITLTHLTHTTEHMGTENLKCKTRVGFWRQQWAASVKCGAL